MKHAKKDAITDLAHALAQEVMTDLQAQDSSVSGLEDGQVINVHGEVINLQYAQISKKSK